MLLAVLSGASSAADLVVDGTTLVIADEERTVNGNVIVRNGGRLEMNRAKLHLLLDYDEQYNIQLQGNVTLSAADSRIDAVGGQTSIETSSVGGRSPTMTFTRTVVTNHAGIRPRGTSVVNATDSPIEEIQVHDAAQVTVTGRGLIYPVFFFEGFDGSVSGLQPGSDVSFTLSATSGWKMAVAHATVVGYQIDLDGSATVDVSNSSGIVMSIHTPGSLGPEERVIQLTTSGVPVSGVLSALGPVLRYNNTGIELLNVYLRGNDRVKINDTHVNEANLYDNSQLTLSECPSNYNLYQAYDASTLVITGGSTFAGEMTPPSLTTQGRATATIIGSDVQKLQITAIEDSKVELRSCRNVTPSLYKTLDRGAVVISVQSSRRRTARH